MWTHFKFLRTEIKTKKWSEYDLFRRDKESRIILTATCKKYFIPEIIMKKYVTQKEIRIHDGNQITLDKIMGRVTDLVNACCRPSAESRLNTESRVTANDDRFDVNEMLPSKKGIMILMAIWSKTLLRIRDDILRIRNSSIEPYDGMTMDDIIRDMKLGHVLPRGHYLRSRVSKRAKRKIMERDDIDADACKRSHLRRRVGSFEHEHFVFKPHEVEVVEAELKGRMEAHGIPTTSTNSEGGGNGHSLDMQSNKPKFSDIYTPACRKQVTTNGGGQDNGHSHIRNSKNEIYRIDDWDIYVMWTHFKFLRTEIKTQKWSEYDLFRRDKESRIILTATCKKYFIPEIIMKKYVTQKEIRIHDGNQITLDKIMGRVTDLVNACCRPSAESRLNTESRVTANDDRFDVNEMLPSKKGIMILMAIWSKTLLRIRDDILRIRNSSIEPYDGMTMDDIIRDMKLGHVLPRGHYLRSRVSKRAKRKIMERDDIDADACKRSHLRRRVGSFEHEHFVFKPHEVEVVEAELKGRMEAHGIPTTSTNSEGGGNGHSLDMQSNKPKFSDIYTPACRKQVTTNGGGQDNGHSHIRNSKNEIYRIDDWDIYVMWTHFKFLRTEIKTKKWSEYDLFRRDKESRIILTATCKKYFIPEIIMKKYVTQKEIRIHDGNQITLDKIMGRVTDLVNACCRPSAESRLNTESRVTANDDRFDVNEMLPSKKGIMILMAIWSKTLLRIRDDILRIRNSSIEPYDGMTMDDIIRDMKLGHVLPRGHYLRSRVSKRAKRKIMERDDIDADACKRSHLRRRVGSFEHEHFVFKPHEVEVVEAELKGRMEAHGIPTTSTNSEGGGNGHSLDMQSNKPKFSDIYTPACRKQVTTNGGGQDNGHSHIRNSKNEIYRIDDWDIYVMWTHFKFLRTEIKTQKWSEYDLFRRDKESRIILTATCKKYFIPEIIMKKYVTQKEIRIHDGNQITLDKIMGRVTDLVNACCRPSAESRLNTESRVTANDDRFDVNEMLPSKKGIMILMAIWSKTLLRIRDDILRIRNSSIEPYDGMTMDDIIRDMKLGHVLPRGHYLRSRVSKRAKRKIMERDDIDADACKRSHLRRRVGSFEHEHFVFKPHEVEVVEAELKGRMEAHGIPTTSTNSEGGGNGHSLDMQSNKPKFSDIYTPACRKQVTTNGGGQDNGHSHIRNSKNEIYRIDDWDIYVMWTHFKFLRTEIKTQNWSEYDLFRRDKESRIILTATCKKYFIPEIIMKKYVTQKEIRIHDGNQITLDKIMGRVTDLVNACCRPSAESRLNTESRVTANDDRFDVNEMLPSKKGIMILMAIWSKTLLRIRDDILRIRNSSIEPYDGMTMDDIIRDMKLGHVLPRGHYLRSRVSKRAKRKIMERDDIDADACKRSHLRRRVGSFEHEHFVFKPHEVEVVEAELKGRMEAHGIPTTSPG